MYKRNEMVPYYDCSKETTPPVSLEYKQKMQEYLSSPNIGAVAKAAAPFLCDVVTKQIH